jgi:superfamily II DNA or RNA helicase
MHVDRMIFAEEKRNVTSGRAVVQVRNFECTIVGDAPTDALKERLSYQDPVVAKFLRTGHWGEVVEAELKRLEAAANSPGAAMDLAMRDHEEGRGRGGHHRILGGGDGQNAVEAARKRFFAVKKEANTVSLYDVIKKTFPVTLLKTVLRVMRDSGIKYKLEDLREPPKKTLKLKYDPKKHEPREYQDRAVEIAQHCRKGTFAMATNAGKTSVTMRIIEKKGLKTLILVQKQELLHQISDEIRSHLGVDPGMAGGGFFKLEPITVAIVNTAHTRIQEFINYGFDQVIVDEGHHAASRIHFTVLDKIKPYSIYSMTGTDFRTKRNENIVLAAAFGGTVYRIDNQFMVSEGYSAKIKAEILRHTVDIHPSFTWNTVYERGILHSLSRNELLADAVAEHAKNGETILVLTDQTGHGQTIANLLMAKGLDTRFMHGECPREERVAAMLDFKERKFQVLVGTTIYDEGVDFPTLDVVAFAAGKKAKGKVFQRLGRGQRKGFHADGTRKEEAIVIDIFDDGHRLLKRHSMRRLLAMHEVGVVLPEKYVDMLIEEGFIHGGTEAGQGEPSVVRRRHRRMQEGRQGQGGYLHEDGGGDVPRPRRQRV